MGPESCLPSLRTWDSFDNFTIPDQDSISLEKDTTYHVGIAADGSSVVIFQRTDIAPVESVSSIYTQYSWSLENRSPPELLSTAVVNMNLGTKDENRIATPQSDNPKIISFSSDLSCIRLGPRILIKEKNGNYLELDDLDLMTGESPPRFEPVGFHRSYLVLASREKMTTIPSARSGIPKQVASKETEKPEAKDVAANEAPDNNASTTASSPDQLQKAPSDGEVDNESASTSSEAESSAWNSAEESWSEASTDADDEVNSPIGTLDSSDDESSEASESETESENDNKSSQEDDASDAPVATQGGLLQDSASDDGEANLDWLDDDDSYEGASGSDVDAGFSSNKDSDAWSSEDEAFFRSYGRSRAKCRPKGQQGLLMVYDLSSGHAVQVFKFTHSLTTVLDKSPPAIHPSKSLVVCPLSGGDVLFADYEVNSYFIRKFKPSTRKASHEFIKCHFSSCGNFLHIASLEAQPKPVTKREVREGAKPSMSLSALVSTHRLSKRKTTRSPPTLIHRVKFSLREHSSTEAPIQVSWSPKHAYFSSSSESNKLSLFRADLFKLVDLSAPPKAAERNPVSIPKESVLLPESAHSVGVCYFAPRPQDGGRALLFIGSSSKDHIKDDEAGSVDKAGKNENVEADEKAKGEKADADGSNNAKPEDTEDSGKEQIEEKLQDEKISDNKTRDDKPIDTAKDKSEPNKVFSPPAILYLNVDTDLGGWIPCDTVEELKSDTTKGSLEPKMDKFIQDDCDC